MSKTSSSILGFFKLIGVGVMGIFGALRYCDDGARLLKNSDNVYDGARYMDNLYDGSRAAKNSIYNTTDEAVLFKNTKKSSYTNDYIENSTVYIDSENSFDWRIAVLKDRFNSRKTIKNEVNQEVVIKPVNQAKSDYLDQNFKGMDGFEKLIFQQRMQRQTLMRISKVVLKSIKFYYKEYEEDKSKLDRQFGENHSICKEFEAAFFLEGDLPKAKESMIPGELKGFDTNHKAYKLFAPLKETILNEEQAKALEEVLDIPLGETAEKEKNIIFLENKEGMLQMKGTGNLLLLSPLEYGVQFPYENESTIVLSGYFTEKEIELLEGLEVKEVVRIEDYQ